jgi:hypothetical protein
VKDKSRLPRTFLAGQRFGKLTVLPVWRRDAHWTISWLCRCDCPDKTPKWIVTSSLVGGLTASCGCLQRLPKKPAPVVPEDDEPELDRLGVLEERLRERFQLVMQTGRTGKYWGVWDAEFEITLLVGDDKQQALAELEERIAAELREARLPYYQRFAAS